MPWVQDQTLRRKRLSPQVREALGHAASTDTFDVILLYDTDKLKPMAARETFAMIDGLHVTQGYPPTLPVSGTKEAIMTALANPLATGAAMDYQDYSRYHLIPRRGHPGKNT